MAKEQGDKVVVLLDVEEMDHVLNQAGLELDLMRLCTYLYADRHLVECYAYLPKDRALSEQETSALHQVGCLLRESFPKGDRMADCNASVAIAMDVLFLVEHHRPDTVVFASNDSALIPLIERLRLMGVRVEIATVARVAPRALQLTASGLIDLDQISQPVEHLRMVGETRTQTRE